MEYLIDARGLACPGPAMKARKALVDLDKGTVVVIVDDGGARNNVSRLARNMGCKVAVEKKDRDYLLTISKQ